MLKKGQLPVGYRMPAEWEQQDAIWLSWPHNTDTWPLDGKWQHMIIAYSQIIKAISGFQKVNINVSDIEMELSAKAILEENEVSLTNVHFYHHPTNDAWCRDHGPVFVKNSNGQKAIINWEYNAWGGKYPPYNHDNHIPVKISEVKQIPVFTPGIVLEGGSIEVNGKGTLLTTKACLLNKNRNPHLDKSQIEEYLKNYLGVNNILWLEDGIVGDDTDGHIDDLSRFVNATTIVTAVENDPEDDNYHILKENLETLRTLKDQDGNPFHIEELPMPSAVVMEGIRLPASYANFLITNNVVVVPVFNDKNDGPALKILQDQFKDRKVVGVNCRELVWGLGTIHCLSQQEPL